MRIFRGYRDVESPPPESVVTLGNFDGVHLGHQHLFAKALALAGARGGEAVVFTFRPHPVKVLAPDLAPPLICTYEEKLRLIARHGIEIVVEEEFNRELSGYPPREFVERILVRALGAREVVVGYDFTFGRDRAGTTKTLGELGDELGFVVHLVEAVRIDGLVASSTKVREFILEGKVRGAAIILGRDFALCGEVVRGEGRGRSIGFPTANLHTTNELIPKPGVYACRADVRGARHLAVTNVGYAPTFHGRELTVEAHLLDLDADLYGEEMNLQFCQRLRAEHRFGSVEELTRQIARDVDEARVLL